MNEPLPEQLALVKQWISYAGEDLQTAELLLKADADCPFRAVCFHAQQSIEKYLKALLVHHSVDFPRIHDLGELMLLLPVDLDLPQNPETLRMITDYATVSRYPGELDDIDRSEAEDAVDVARQSRNAVLGHLPKGVTGI